MSQGNIGERGLSQTASLNRKMTAVAAVGQKDLNPAVVFDIQCVETGFRDFCCVVAEAVDLGITVFEDYGIHLFTHKKRNIGTPGKTHEGGIGTHVVMVSGNDYHPDGWNSREKVVNLF